MSSVAPFLPLNWLVAAARLTRLATPPSVFRVAAPNFNVSSQNTTKTPRGAAENGTKPTLTASGIGKSSKNLMAPGREPAGGASNDLVGCEAQRQEHGQRHYGLSAAALPSVVVAGRSHNTNC